MNVGVVGNPNYPDLGAFLATLRQKASSVGITLYSEERIQALWPAPGPSRDGAVPPRIDAVNDRDLVTAGEAGRHLRDNRVDRVAQHR